MNGNNQISHSRYRQKPNQLEFKTQSNGHNSYRLHKDNEIPNGIHRSTPTKQRGSKQPASNSHSLTPQSDKNGSNAGTTQNLHTIQLQFKAVIRGYEIKVRNLEEQYRRNRQEMQGRIKELFKQKNHWQNIAEKYQKTLGSPSKEYQPDQKVLQKLQNQNAAVVREKERLSKQLQILSNQNRVLKQKIVQLNKMPSARGSVSPSLRSTPPRISKVVNLQEKKNIHIPLSSPKQSQNQKQAIEKMKAMISELNQEIIKLRISELNSKYSKNHSTILFHSTSATSSRVQSGTSTQNQIRK